MQTTETIISKETLKKLLDIEKLRYCFECGICTASCPMAELLGKDYNPRWLLEKVFLNPESVLNSDALWLCAWCYRCYRHCPQALRIPEIFLFIRKTAAEHGFLAPLDKALPKIVENIPLPLATTLVCFHPERAGLDREKILERIEQIRFENLKKRKRTKTAGIFQRKVAVIGSGPAGLTVAHQLAQKKCKVTIFEALPEAGGMLRKCIPEYRLPKQVLAKEIDFIRDLKVEIRTGVTVGKDLSFEDLRKEGYKAIFIGVGAHESQKLKVEGTDLEGVIHALDFLWKINSGEKTEMGKNIAIIGGGNVAIDAARTALQNGAKEVTIFYRRSREEMPANPWEVKEAEDEGVKIEFLVAPKRFLGKNGKVSSIEFVRMQLGESDESGRRKPIPIEGSEFSKEADMVILAIGETPNLTFLPKEIELNEDGTVWIDPITMETSLKGVFAGGDAATGPATVIEAIKAGKRAAESIGNYLESLGG
ncbi:MAG: FAD-dependent oxidoreductase [Candidatus Bathyarchaeota archaeon]|nr:FAD-dependent oxidoreductase [Candidatus Bathyarchaeota archaeon]